MLAQRRKLLQCQDAVRSGAEGPLCEAGKPAVRLSQTVLAQHPRTWSLNMLLGPALPVSSAFACCSCPILHDRPAVKCSHPGISSSNLELHLFICATCHAGPAHITEEQWCRGISILRALCTAGHSLLGRECMTEGGLESICGIQVRPAAAWCTGVMTILYTRTYMA